MNQTMKAAIMVQMGQSCTAVVLLPRPLPTKKCTKIYQSVFVDMSLGCFADMESDSSEISGSVSGSGYSSSSEATDDDEPA